jgi:EAL domain-containing protein (putative c-di-GMP-specific phosphodiesterase class I)
MSLPVTESKHADYNGNFARDASAGCMTRLSRERDRFVAFTFAAADVVVEIDASTKIVFAAGAASRLCGVSAEALVGTLVLDLFAPSERNMVRQLVASISRGGRFAPVSIEMAIAGAPNAVIGGCCLPATPDVVHIVISGTGHAARRGSASLQNESDFVKRATVRLHDASDTADKPYEMTLMSIDGLDALRERAGEGASTALPEALSRYIAGALSPDDIASEIGDGRYAVLHQSPIDTVWLSQTIEGLASSLDPTGKGISLRAARLEMEPEMLNEADTARALVHSLQRFAAEKAETFTITSLKDGFQDALKDTLTTIATVRGAVARGAFTLVYQPVVDLLTNKTHHVEALSRFNGDESPAKAIAVAESTGMIADFDLVVCERVIETLAQIDGDRPFVAVNLSGRSLESRVFCETLLRLFDDHPTTVKHVLIEVTESAIITETNSVAETIRQLRERGFKICLDDFGSGANGYNYLRSFPVDYVKIDGALVRSAMTDRRDEIILGSIAHLCSDLGMKTIAEMIETDDVAIRMRRLGVTHAQGYFFGKPQADLLRFRPLPPGLVLRAGGEIEIDTMPPRDRAPEIPARA